MGCQEWAVEGSNGCIYSCSSWSSSWHSLQPLALQSAVLWLPLGLAVSVAASTPHHWTLHTVCWPCFSTWPQCGRNPEEWVQLLRSVMLPKEGSDDGHLHQFCFSDLACPETHALCAPWFKAYKHWEMINPTIAGSVPICTIPFVPQRSTF